jgi:hypothetical protein
MMIPNFLDVPMVDMKGMISDSWRPILQQLFQQLQINVGNQGFTVTVQPTATITTLTPTMPNGTIIYDSTLDEFKGMIGGTLKTFTLT